VRSQKRRAKRRFHAVVGDLFDHVEGRFDLIVFDPPFRWFAPRSMAERGMADENYQTLTAFLEQAAPDSSRRTAASCSRSAPPATSTTCTT
jgi:methylase of polypeptide subunit release factors